MYANNVILTFSTLRRVVLQEAPCGEFHVQAPVPPFLYAHETLVELRSQIYFPGAVQKRRAKNE
jgi:hypothetical protein